MTLSHLEFENLPLSQWSENVEIKGLEVLILSFNFSFFELIPHGKITTFEILLNFDSQMAMSYKIEKFDDQLL